MEAPAPASAESAKTVIAIDKVSASASSAEMAIFFVLLNLFILSPFHYQAAVNPSNDR